MRATINDIAREAGCSITTVSLVLNQKKNNISDQKKQEIWEAARRLNYCPNRQAAALVTKRTNTIGLIIPDNCNTFFGSISKEVEIFARQKGYSVIYGNSNNEAENDYRYIMMFLERCVDGIIIVKSASSRQEDSSRLVELLAGATVPVVVLDRAIEGLEAPTYILDNCYGGYIATRHLLELGHRRIGCYTGSMDVSSARERLEGYRRALEEFKVPFRTELLFEGNYQLGKEAQAFAQFESQQVTAVFAHNDIMAYGIYRQIQLAGKSVPDDYSVVGFDDLELSSIITPGLTSVRQPVETMSRDAIERLIGQIQGKDFGQTGRQPSVTAPTLVIRESTRTAAT